ncbi:hypothetical protein EV360DRAFT_90024 [Lentinula raphanica]|nr:hypothetical protein EV360DRAFT_90024 [Lentinula raphanica]
MTRSTAVSRAVAVFIIGAAISSGVLAAPAPSPMTPTTTGAQTQGLISRSSDGPVGMLSEGQTQEFAARQRGGVEHATIVPRQNADRLTFDEPEYGEDASEPKVPVSVNLLKRGNTHSAARGITKKDAIEYLTEHSSEASTYITSIKSQWDDARTTEPESARMKACLQVLAAEDNGVRIRQLYDTLNAAQDPQFHDLQTMTTYLWFSVSDWDSQAHRHATENYARIQPLWKATSRQHDARRALFEKYQYEVEWMADFSKVAFKMQLCDKNLADNYAKLWAKFKKFQQNHR